MRIVSHDTMRTARVIAFLALVIAVIAANDAPYRGNTKTYKFHRATCRYYSCANCTARFKTREEAIAEGYRPCGVCDP
ncbi:MAG TPA: Ada metal-binding domain-containing protein [Thermoanaerobaculia bacterium]|nr:Ada metal-binding domain-containing protein [Thermoanaerobaculia bacterium]